MSQYKVAMNLYVSQCYAEWDIRKRVAAFCDRHEIEMENWQFRWITAGYNSRYDVSFLISAPTKVKAEGMARCITSATAVNQAYIDGIWEMKRTPLYSYQVTVHILLDTFKHNNRTMLHKYLTTTATYKKRKDRITDGPYLNHLVAGFKQWHVECTVMAENQSEARDLAIGAFNCSIVVGSPTTVKAFKIQPSSVEWLEEATKMPSCRIPKAKLQIKIKAESCIGTLGDTQSAIRGLGLAYAERKSMDIYNFEVDVVVSQLVGYVKKRAAELLNGCCYVEDWEILGSEYFATVNETHMHLIIRYQACSLDEAERDISEALNRESHIERWNLTQDTYYGSMSAQVLMHRAAGFTHDQLINTINKLSGHDLEKHVWSRDFLLILMETVLQGRFGSDEDRDELGKEIALLTPCADGWVYTLNNGQTVRVTDVIRIGEDMANISCTVQPASTFPWEVVFHAYTAFYHYINDAGIKEVEYSPKEG